MRLTVTILALTIACAAAAQPAAPAPALPYGSVRYMDEGQRATPDHEPSITFYEGWFDWTTCTLYVEKTGTVMKLDMMRIHDWVMLPKAKVMPPTVAAAAVAALARAGRK